jgi:hypothetical protein
MRVLSLCVRACACERLICLCTLFCVGASAETMDLSELWQATLTLALVAGLRWVVLHLSRVFARHAVVETL